MEAGMSRNPEAQAILDRIKANRQQTREMLTQIDASNAAAGYASEAPADPPRLVMIDPTPPAFTPMTATPLKRKHVPQRYRVLQMALVRGDAGFTRWDAARDVGCFELASRLGELRSEGVVFTRDTSTARNRFQDTVRVMTYRVKHIPNALILHLAELPE
jgi:hypothetical protein